MARKARVEFPGAMYHVLDRGDRREAIYRDDGDRAMFLKAVGDVCGRTGWRVHAYVLMTNHYHILLETPEANLVAGMKWLQGTYTMRFNRRHRLSGHLFQGRYKAVAVDPESRGYAVTLADYIHLNPVRARMIGREERLSEYSWSSFPSYCGVSSGRPCWLETAMIMGELGWEDSAADRRKYAVRMKGRAMEHWNDAEAAAESWQEIRRGWCLGSDGFRTRMLALIDGVSDKLRGNRDVDRSVRRSHDEEEAERIIALGLRFFACEAEEFSSWKKNDVRKVIIGSVIRRNTIVSNEWIGQRLKLGHKSRVSRYCGSGEAEPALAEEIERFNRMATCTR